MELLDLMEQSTNKLNFKPKYRVMALNPHAGEGGLFGREEVDVLKPAVEDLKTYGLEIDGPFASDSFCL